MITDLIGHDVGRYHIIEQLGQGGMATVYKAYDNRLERDVAIKFIRRESVPPDQVAAMLKRFEREAKSLAKLSHPNIVKVHDFGEYEGSPYLVMEYLHGGTLKARAGQAMAPVEAIHWLLPMARALDYAHRRNIIHRDVKPANILITEDGEPMLTDFGIAKILESGEATLTGTGVGIGTPEYMSPEQCEGRNVDRRTDIYALGVVFYELVTGRKPFKADTPMAVVIMHINSPLPRPKDYVPDLPDEVEAALFKALAKNPDERYWDMGAFAAAMEDILRKAEDIPPLDQQLAATMTASIYEQQLEAAFPPIGAGSEERTISAPVEKQPTESVPASARFDVETGATVTAPPASSGGIKMGQAMPAPITAKAKVAVPFSPPVQVEKKEGGSIYRWLIPVLAVGGLIGSVVLVLVVVFLVSQLPGGKLNLRATTTPVPTVTQLPDETLSLGVATTPIPTVTKLPDATLNLGAAKTPTPIEEELFKVWSLGTVYNGITAPTMFTINEPWLVTEIYTYHWNNGQGATPGTISLRSADGTTYGPWQASGQPGQGGVVNAGWLVNPNIVVPPGTYTVLDSDPSTWVQNAETGGAGIARGTGIRQGNP